MLYSISNGGELTIDVLDFRKVLLGKVNFRRCPDCQGDGNIYFDKNGNHISKIEAERLDLLKESERCENCFGLGYIPIPE